MERTTVTLVRGLRVGDKRYIRAELREQTIGDLLDAEDAGGSPLAVGIELLARQIVRLLPADPDGDELAGPIPRVILRRIAVRDLEVLSQAAEALQSRGEDDAELGEAA